jgi:hypothetical protein
MCTESTTIEQSCARCGKRESEIVRSPNSTTRRMVRGLCYGCYRKARRDGSLEKTFSNDDGERFFAKVAKNENGCWEWTAYQEPLGYGKFGLNGSVVFAHRYSYELHKGSIPDGMEIDHLCRNPACVNPAHLEAVTHAVNVRRGDAGKRMRDRTHCPSGHPYDDENTRWYRGMRYCRSCGNARSRASKARKRAAKASAV